MFVTLHYKNHKPVLINSDFISSIHQHEKGGCTVETAEEVFEVTEKFEFLESLFSDEVI